MKTVLSMALALFLVGCGSQEQQHIVKQTKDTNVEVKKVQSAKVTEIVPEVKQEVVPKAIKNIPPLKLSVEDTFKKCSSCHGKNGEKKALGKSQIIKGWKVKKISDALHGYKNGTYGGSMKGLMKGQVVKLSDADIEELSAYISKL